MNTFGTRHGKKDLRLDGRKIRRDADGKYLISYHRLLQQDLAGLPVGTVFHFTDKEYSHPRLGELVVFTELEVLASRKVRASIYIDASFDQDDPMSFLFWMAKAPVLMQNADFQNAGFDYAISEQIYSTTVDAGSGNEIFERVHRKVTSSLQPLLDFRNKMLQESKYI